MRNLRELDEYRQTGDHVVKIFGSAGNENCGAFMIPSAIDRQPLRCLASADKGWDHVSVSLDHRIPYWIEMEQIKRLFFKAREAAMQLHMPPSKHIDIHPNCLHLWRPRFAAIPLPPEWMV